MSAAILVRVLAELESLKTRYAEDHAANVSARRATLMELGYLRGITAKIERAVCEAPGAEDAQALDAISLGASMVFGDRAWSCGELVAQAHRGVDDGALLVPVLSVVAGMDAARLGIYLAKRVRAAYVSADNLELRRLPHSAGVVTWQVVRV